MAYDFVQTWSGDMALNMRLRIVYATYYIRTACALGFGEALSRGVNEE
jgi:hypothetical protein